MRQQESHRASPPGHGPIHRLHVTLWLREEVVELIDAMRGDLSRPEFLDLVVDSAVRRAAGLPRGRSDHRSGSKARTSL